MFREILKVKDLIVVNAIICISGFIYLTSKIGKNNLADAGMNNLKDIKTK